MTSLRLGRAVAPGMPHVDAERLRFACGRTACEHAMDKLSSMTPKSAETQGVDPARGLKKLIEEAKRHMVLQNFDQVTLRLRAHIHLRVENEIV